MAVTFLTSNPGANDDPAQPHLILVGLPGAGKSTVGMEVASRLGRSFLDFDAEIERREGRRIAEIFAASGEMYFRRCERALTDDVVKVGNMVLSPGGGWVTSRESVARLRPPARMVYLRVSPEVALERMSEAAADRPLLRGPNPLVELWRLYEQREPYYMAADLHVDTELVTLQEVTELLQDYMRVVSAASPGDA